MCRGKYPGFTLIEILICLMILSMITGALVALTIAGMRMYRNTTGHIDPWCTVSRDGKTFQGDQVITQDQNLAMKMLQRDLREATGESVGGSGTCLRIDPPIKDQYQQNVLSGSGNLSSLQPDTEHPIFYFLGDKPTPANPEPKMNVNGDCIFRYQNPPGSTTESLDLIDAANKNTAIAVPGARLVIAGVESQPVAFDAQGNKSTNSIFAPLSYNGAKDSGSTTYDPYQLVVTLTIRSMITSRGKITGNPRVTPVSPNSNQYYVENPLVAQFYLRNVLPSVISITPNPAKVSDILTITGEHLRGVSTVWFTGATNSTPVQGPTPFQVSDNQIQVAVPTGAKPGQVTVFNPHGPNSPGNSSNLTIESPISP